jgi:hypothetical protein
MRKQMKRGTFLVVLALSALSLTPRPGIKATQASQTSCAGISAAGNQLWEQMQGWV